MKINLVDENDETFDSIEIPDAASIDLSENRRGFLDQKVCREFRETINSSPIFAYDPKYLAQYNLCCAVMDRLDTCVERLNKYGEYPDSEEEFLVFMMFACMTIDAVKEILSELGVHGKKEPIYGTEEDYKFFKKIYTESRIYNPDSDIPDDDRFFEYLRSLMFAHPFETSRPKFLKKGEKQFSPWVIVNYTALAFSEYPYSVGVRIYTNMTEDIIDLRMPFGVLKDYIKSRYERLRMAIVWARKQITLAVGDWKKTKVSRNKAPLDTLIEIDQILSSRYVRCYSCKEAITYLGCQLTMEENAVSVERFRNAIISEIPAISDAVDALDNELVEEIFDRIFARPTKMHAMAHYQLEKIFTHLHDNAETYAASSGERWALFQANAFAEQFAKKWVTIQVYDMPYCEIKLLVRTACYLERQEQEATP